MLTKIKGDIVQIEADVIINAANTELKHGGGVAKAIAKAAGEILEKESRKIGFVPLGEFAVTNAGNLKAKKVIHIPTIDYQNNKSITYEELEKVWRKVLEYCQKQNFKNIATPLLGTGVVGLNKEKVERILLEISQEFENLEVRLVCKE